MYIIVSVVSNYYIIIIIGLINGERFLTILQAWAVEYKFLNKCRKEETKMSNNQ